jgi:Zn-dependent metalloprotease
MPNDPRRSPGRAVCGILPPHILIAICENGTAQERGFALATLVLSERLRARRQALSDLPAVVPAGQKRRTVFDAKHSETLPGTLVRAEGDPASSDVAVNEAYDGAGATFDLYERVYGRSSIDGRGMRLDSSVHYGDGYDNAFWSGSQMVYGDGDGKLFGRFTKSVDVIGHELTHGVTAHEARLDYHDQPGALNESFSDVFGSLVIGAGLFTPRVRGVGLRSMKAPGTAYDDPILGKDPQPAHMRDYVSGPEDDGGVHINSGIPNRAFFLAAHAIGGHAWEKAGKIWYVALTDRLRHDSKFAAAARLTAAVAGELFGAGGKEETAVREAWRAVGVLP